MKNEIYNEIRTLETSFEIYKKRKGKCIRFIADNISCFYCIDTKKNWKKKDNNTSNSLNNKGEYEIVGCLKCNNIGFISVSQTNNITFNGFKLFEINNNNWMQRIDEMHNKASSDINIINKVNDWINNNYSKNKNIKNETLKNETLKNETFKNETLKIEPLKNETLKNKTLDDTTALFEICKRITKEYTEKSFNVDIEVGKIIELINITVETYFGNLFSLVNLSKELKMSFLISENHYETNDKVIKIKDNNYLGIKTYTKISNNIIQTNFCGKKKFAKVYMADIFILKPLNKKAIDKANNIMGKIGEDMTDNILKDF